MRITDYRAFLKLSMSRKENILMKMVLLGITEHGCGVWLFNLIFCVCLFLFGPFFWSSLLSLAALWAEEALRCLPQLLKQEEAWL